ncbi:MAG: iron-containing alcohol dehydrogenase [Candidatus Hodarchaeales archaeon]
MTESETLESIVPRSIIIGKSILEKIPQIIGSLGINQKVMILSGPRTRHIIGEKVYDILSNHGLNCENLIVETSILETVNTYVEIVEQTKPDILICAGGGKVIDVGKYCLHQIVRKIEMISLPTSTPHDGLASPFIYLNNPTESYIGECRPPVAVIADIEIILQHPDLIRFLAAGVGDTIGKITSIWDWKYAWRIKSEKFSGFVGGVLENSEILFKSQVSEALIDPEHAIQVILKALLIAGVLMGTSNNIRVGFGSEHMFAMALSAVLHEEGKEDILHGERVALGTIMMACLQGQNYEQIIKILKTAGCPTDIDSLEQKIPPEAVVKALQRAHTVSSKYTVLGQSGLTEKAAWTLAQITGVVNT